MRLGRRLAHLPLLLALVQPGAAVAATQVDIDTLSEKIRSQGTKIVERKDCEEGVQGFYQFEERKLDQLTICVNNIEPNDLDQVWEVLAHETTHIMQACDQSGEGEAFNDAFFPRIYRELQQLNSDGIGDINLYGSWSKRQEIEARYMELVPPGDVIEIFLSSQCFVQPEAQPSSR